MSHEWNVQRQASALGAEVSGVDLNAVIERGDDDETHAIYDLLIEHQVLFFRRQPLTPEAHGALGRSLGELSPPHHSYPTLPGDTDVAVIDWAPDDRPDASEWHSDMTFRPKPPFASVLRAVLLPPIGGDTLWASMYSALDALDPGFRRDIEGMQADHDPGQFRNGAYENGGNQGITDMHVAAGSAVWPIVSHHPVTGRPYLNVSESNTRWIIGSGAAESARILNYLFDVIKCAEHQVRLRWEPDTVAIWDNRGTQHYACADYAGHRRLMHRVAVDTDRRLDASVAAHQSVDA